jgi:hypothetical protein
MNLRNVFRTLAAIFVFCLLFQNVVAFAAKTAKVHTVGLGSGKRVPYSAATDPSGALGTEKDLHVRPLIVDDKVKDWTTGESHAITDRSFAVRRALRLNDALPGDKGEHWIWQKGPWLLVDRTNGHYVALKLPEYDPAVSQVIWYRDYAAYCGLSASGKQLYAVVAQLGARKPVLSKKLAPWSPHEQTPGDLNIPACGATGWQREPLRVTFQHTGEAAVSYDLVGSSAVMVEEGDGAEEPASDGPAKSAAGSQ